MFSIQNCYYHGLALSYIEGEGKAKFMFEFQGTYKKSVNLSLMRILAKTYEEEWTTWLNWKADSITFHTESELGAFDVTIPKTPEALACLEVWRDMKKEFA